MKLSIINKFVFGFLIIFCIGYVIMTCLINNMIVENNRVIVRSSLKTYQRDLSLYLKEYFNINELEMNETNIQADPAKIASELALRANNRIILYSADGEFLSDSANVEGRIIYFEGYDKANVKSKNKGMDSINFRQEGDSDINLAINNKSSFIIVPYGDKYIVAFSCPIIVNNERIGIFRITKDYSEIIKSSMDLLGLINKSIIFVFGAIFTFIILLSRKLTVPIVKLSKASKEIAMGNFDTEINIISNDEIGNLSKDFNIMKDKLEQQINVIKTDRDRLQKLEGFRKAFFDNVTHEMKTPLTIISGYTQIIFNKGFDDKVFIKKSIYKIKSECDRLHNMVLNLLEVSKAESDISSHALEIIDLSDLLENACDDMRIKADKYKSIITKEIQDDVNIYGNKAALRSLIINLIDNALKHSGIQISVKITLFEDSEHCVLKVEDNGKGIAQEKLCKIFDRFYKADTFLLVDKESSGLGLSIVKQIVNKHKGEIKINSEQGLGTEVVVRIPLNI